MKTVSYYTLGCKLNFSETSTISRGFTKANFTKVEIEMGADICVINTCSVTDNADKKFKTIVRKILGYNPNTFIVAIGCFVQLKPNEVADVDGVDLVLGASEKFNILHYIDGFAKNENAQIHSCEISDVKNYDSSYSYGDRTRAFLKVQDGCDYKCTYCTIPMARGESRSGKLHKIMDSAKEIVSKNIKEIVLTGVNIGDYGKGEFGDKKHENTFFDLVKKLDEITGLERVRISSIEPNLLRDEIIDFVAESNKFVPHFHIPLQSGSDKILKLMKRRYLTDLYKKKTTHVLSKIPDCCIGVDVIVGFPGETDEDFMQTYNFLNELNIAYLHVFSYSERDNTEAVEMSGVVAKNIRSKRSKMLRILSAKKLREFYEKNLNSTRKVLFETENKDGFLHGFTDNYIKVKTPWNKDLVNSIKEVYLKEIDEKGVVLGVSKNKLFLEKLIIV